MDEKLLGELRDNIKEGEAFRAQVYKDTREIPTIGYGANLTTPSNQAFLESRGYDIQALLDGTQTISTQDAQALLDRDINVAISDAHTFVPNFDTLEPSAQLTVAEMSFNLGLPKLEEFENLQTNLLHHDYEAAAKELHYGGIGDERYNHLVDMMTQAGSEEKGESHGNVAPNYTPQVHDGAVEQPPHMLPEIIIEAPADGDSSLPQISPENTPTVPNVNLINSSDVVYQPILSLPDELGIFYPTPTWVDTFVETASSVFTEAANVVGETVIGATVVISDGLSAIGETVSNNWAESPGHSSSPFEVFTPFSGMVEASSSPEASPWGGAGFSSGGDSGGGHDYGSGSGSGWGSTSTSDSSSHSDSGTGIVDSGSDI